MNDILIDATMLRSAGNCKEFFRRQFVENIVPVKPAIHREFGIAIHRAVQFFWNGSPYEDAYEIAAGHLALLDETGLNVREREKLDEMRDYLPDLLAVYYESHEQEPAVNVMLEREFVHKNYLPGVHLCGRIDRFTFDLVLSDLKTASEIGRNWKSDYKEAALRDCALPLYDWAITQMQPDSAPKSIQLEVLIKPYKSKPTRLEVVPLNEIIAYRERFKRQLDWRVRELVHYIRTYGQVQPWPMNDGSQCVSKFGPCEYLPLCNWVSTPKNLKLYKQREEHLESRRNG